MQEEQELPKGWVWTTVSKVGKSITGNTPSTSRPEFYGGNIPFFKPSDLGVGYALHKAETTLTEAGAISARVLPAHSVLVTCIGATIGKTGFSKVAGATNQQINALVPNDAIVLPEFAYFAFISPILFHQILENASSTTLPILNKSKFEALELPVPLLKRYRQSVLHAAVTGALTSAWRTAHPAPAETGAALLARIRAERRAQWEAAQQAKRGGQLPLHGAWKNKYEEPAAVDTSELPELPEGWVWAGLGECFDVFVGATPSRPIAEYWNGVIPWVSSGEVAFCRIKKTRETITEAGLANSSTNIHPKGTVLIGMIGEGKTRGQVAILDIEATNNQNCAAIRVSETDVLTEYIYHYLSSVYDETRRNSAGNNQPALNKTRVQAMVFPLPPLAEQAEIVAEAERRLSTIDALELTLAAELKRAERLRQSLLHRAFTGRLVPQDATDEPAGELLARLAAQAPLPKRGGATAAAAEGGSRRGRPRKVTAEAVAEVAEAPLPAGTQTTLAL
jgi:type I restriction enzyme, S subunit